MAVSVEIIDFTRPVANSKNLYISGIVTNDLNEAEIMDMLYKACSDFGLVYEVQVFGGAKCSKLHSRASDESASYYAFVKFYSYFAAQRAKCALGKQLKIGSQPCKVVFATRNKETEAGQTLYVGKCQELANFYLGFNGWMSAIRRMEEDKDVSGEESDLLCHVRFFCVVDLSFPYQGVTSQGVGAWEETYCKRDPSSKTTAILKARKRSQQRALEDAFSRVLLVVLGSGKVIVEIDTTKGERLSDLPIAYRAQEQVLQVTELGEQVQDETFEFSQDTSMDMDDVNLHILQELGDAAT